MEELKKLIEAQGVAFEAFRKANDERLAQIEKRGTADAVTVASVEKLNAELTRLDAAIKTATGRLDEQERRANRPRLPGGDAPSAEQVEHRQAWEGFMRRGVEGNLRELERRSMSVGSDPDGGVLVPAEVEQQIDRVLTTVSAMRRIAQVITIGAASYKKAVTTSGAAYGWGGETTAPGETGTPAVAELEFVAGLLYCEPRATQQLLEDAQIDIAGWLAGEVQLAFAEGEGAAFISGNGINRPRGLLSYTPIANASYAWGSVGYIATGASGAFATEDPGDKLIELQHALKQGYRPGAQWLMNDSVLRVIRQMKDDQDNYLWRPGLEMGAPSTLLGSPVAIDDNMPNLGADSYSVAFGNFARAYVIVDRRGIALLRDPYTAKPYTKFYTTKRVGGGIQNFEAVKLMKFGSS